MKIFLTIKRLSQNKLYLRVLAGAITSRNEKGFSDPKKYAAEILLTINQTLYVILPAGRKNVLATAFRFLGFYINIYASICLNT